MKLSFMLGMTCWDSVVTEHSWWQQLLLKRFNMCDALFLILFSINSNIKWKHKKQNVCHCHGNSDAHVNGASGQITTFFVLIWDVKQRLNTNQTSQRLSPPTVSMERSLWALFHFVLKDYCKFGQNTKH